ncbi:MAG: hypothetical protein JSS65_06740 [Armatimonadetes bacterium]|nr:hypothetical protein [Armatimonadota bacterium]
MTRKTLLAGLCLVPYALLAASPLQDQAGQSEFYKSDVADPVARLVQDMKSGKATLDYEPKQGYLKSLLDKLGVPPSSQLLVFSKTSLQSQYISPSNPRAVYFNAENSIGWIPGAPYIEIMSIDPEVGPVFYILANQKSDRPDVQRKTDDCFQCHFTPATGNVPGLLARSVFVAPDGSSRLAFGSYKTTASSPMEERWGGWYVTGTHGSMRHMGNEVARGSGANDGLDRERGANKKDLASYCDVKDYLTGHSDIVALMVFEHQLTVVNLATRAGQLTRRALAEAKNLTDLKFDAKHIEQQLNDRVAYACEPLVKALLHVGEPTLTSPIAGTSQFTAHLSQSAPSDKDGRRLSDLNLKTRLFRYPCSPLVYSKSIEGLPAKAKARVFERLRQVLSGSDQTLDLASFSSEDKKAALDILSQSVPQFGSRN